MFSGRELGTRRKNIIVYLSDQQRADTLGCYGQKIDISPVLDQLAEEGVLFENAFTCQPVCGPARACLQTGTYTNINGCHVNDQGLRLDEVTIAKELKKAGYETAYVGKWHLANDIAGGITEYTQKAIPLARMGGYEDYIVASELLELTSHGYDGHLFDKDGKQLDFIGYRTDCVTDYAIHYLQNRKTEAPFFLFISHIEPHQQNDHDRFEGPDGSKERFKDYEVPKDLIDAAYPGDWEKNYPDYLGQCRKLDDNLGKVVATLKEQGIYDETVIIFSSDHGCHFKTQEGEYKRNCFEGCLRIPLVIRGGDFIGGKRIDRLVSNIHLPATILTLAQVKIPEKMTYEPLQEALGETCPFGEVIFYQISEAQLGRGIRTRKWKYFVDAPHMQPYLEMNVTSTPEEYHTLLRKCKPDSEEYIEKYLFDLENDPYEKKNLAADPDYSDVRSALQKTLCDCMIRAGEKTPHIYPYGTQLPKQY